MEASSAIEPPFIIDFKSVMAGFKIYIQEQEKIAGDVKKLS
jgi:hypothetical protein